MRKLPKKKAHCRRGHILSGDNVQLRTRKSGYTHRVCRVCTELRSKRFRKINAERLSFYEKQRGKTAARKTQQENARWKFYGLKDATTGVWFTRQHYDQIFETQKGICAVCELTGTLVPDHNHDTGHVRGLVHENCNVLIGFAKDSPALLRQAADYLEKSSDDQLPSDNG